jgi:hypothetical protein
MLYSNKISWFYYIFSLYFIVRFYLNYINYMYSKWKSRIINNGIIFVVGMLCSFFVFSFLINDSLTTANIWDAFTSSTSKKSNFILSLDKNNILSLESTVNIASGIWKSLRISLLYNDTLKDIITQSLQSSYEFSFVNKNNSLIVFIDMNKQNIKTWKKIFLLPLDNITSQNIPIIESVTLFDGNQIDVLSIENTTNSSIHH